MRRKEKINAEKSKATAERRKRDLVKARKNYLGHKINDILTFLNNSELLWDFIGMEKDWQTLSYWVNSGEAGESELYHTRSIMGHDDTESLLDQQADELLNLMKKDQFELEKMILKRDQEILNYCIHFDQ